MQTIFESCQPRADVLAGELGQDSFAARLKDVINQQADAVYQNPQRFFDNTYPTEGLKLLLDEAMGRLTGVKPMNSPLIRLETAFGGGKTHNLIALYHIVHGYKPPENFLDPALIISNPINSVGLVGYDLNPSDGLHHGNVTTYTLWGELAYQLGGEAGYEWVSQSDKNRSAPGTDFLDAIIGHTPTLIMLDEVARYLRAAKSVPTVTGKSDLAEQSIAFLMSLFEFVVSRKQVVLVMTLADTTDAFGDETELLHRELTEAKRLSARQERVITPTGETEIAAIVTHRLFESIDATKAQQVTDYYAETYHRLMEQNSNLPQRAIRAEYAQEMLSDYPFHPELLTTLNRKTSTIPNFQKTRGALRLLALVVRRLWETRPSETYFIHPFHLDLTVEDIINDLTSRLERPSFRQVVEADIVSLRQGSPAHANVIDERWVAAKKPRYAYRVATTAFLHSLTQGSASGVDLADLTLAVVTPHDDTTLINQAIERLVGSCWFFDWDGHRYRFKTEPSLNKVVADEMGNINQTTAKAELERRIRQVWRRSYFEPIYFPSEPGDVDDDAKLPKLVVMHYDAVSFASKQDELPELVKRIFDRAGALTGYRNYKNNLMFLVADQEQVANLVEVVKRYLAINRILADSGRMQEFKEQAKRLKQLGEAAELEVRIAITKTYRYLFYPSADAPSKNLNLNREQLPAQGQGEVNKDQSQVVLRVLKQLEKVLTADDATMSATFIKAKAWDHEMQSISTEALRKVFAQRTTLKMLLDINQLKNSIRNGITQGVWIYYEAQSGLGYDADSPPSNIQIDDNTFLYTLAEAKRLSLSIKGKEATTTSGVPHDTAELCPLCGQPQAQCICGEDDNVGKGSDTSRPTMLQAEGVPAQAFQKLFDECQDHHITSLQSLTLSLDGRDQDGATKLKGIGLIIPQLGRGNYKIELQFSAEFAETETLTINYKGSWSRYKSLKPLVEGQTQTATKMMVKLTLSLDATQDELVVTVAPNNALTRLNELATQLGLGRIKLIAKPIYPS